MKPNGQPERWIIAARLSRVTKSVRLRGDDVINGIHTQDEMCVDWAQAEAHSIVHVCKDRGVSGQVPPWERRELGPWLAEPDKLVQYDGIVASSADRLSRKYLDGAWLRDWAERHGKKLYVVKMRLGWPHSGNGLVWAIEFERAQQELEDITERIGRQRQALTAAGKMWGRPPFGYTTEGDKYDRRMVPTEEGRYYVPLIFEHLIDGWSQRRIAQWLNDEGVRPESGTWWTRTIGTLVRNPAYMGHRSARDFIPADEEEKIDGKVVRWRYGDTWVTYPRWVYGKTIHLCEPLVDAATWRKANEALSDVRPKRGSHVAANRAMLAGALYCAECEDSPMYRHHSPSPRKGRARIPMFYYRCRNRAQRASCGLMLRMETADEAVDRIMRSRFNTPVMKKRVERGNLAAVEKELEEIRFELRRLGSRELPRAEHRAEEDRLWAEEDRIKATPIVEDTVVEVPTGETYAAVWERLPVHERGAWLASNGFRVTASKAKVTVAKDAFVAEESLLPALRQITAPRPYACANSALPWGQRDELWQNRSRPTRYGVKDRRPARGERAPLPDARFREARGAGHGPKARSHGPYPGLVLPGSYRLPSAAAGYRLTGDGINARCFNRARLQTEKALRDRSGQGARARHHRRASPQLPRYLHPPARARDPDRRAEAAPRRAARAAPHRGTARRGSPAMSTARGPIPCPSCGGKVPGFWHEGRDTDTQQCPSCSHVFDAAWPGFPMEPETVIIEHAAGEERRRGAA